MPESLPADKPGDQSEKRPFSRRRHRTRNRPDKSGSPNSAPREGGETRSPARTPREGSETRSPARTPREGGETRSPARTPREGGDGRNDNRNQRRDGRAEGRSSHRNFREKAPAWTAEESLRAKPLPETKAELLEILAAVDPEELMMTPLVSKKTLLEPASETEESFGEEPLELEDGSPRVVIEMVKDCPICGNPIREVMYALHDYEHDRLAHFDCVFKKVSDSLEDKLTDKRYLAYLGSGAFGIMDVLPGKTAKTVLVEKFYPGAPVEELLHAEENQPDDEL